MEPDFFFVCLIAMVVVKKTGFKIGQQKISPSIITSLEVDAFSNGNEYNSYLIIIESQQPKKNTIFCLAEGEDI